MKLFPATKPLDFITMGILGPFAKNDTGYTDMLFITETFTKLACAAALKTTTAPAIAEKFATHWVIPYGIPGNVLTDKGPQFVRKFFSAICLILVITKVSITVYYPQTNGQPERYNQTLVGRLFIFVSEHQTNWDRLIQHLTYAYNSQVNRTTIEKPFSLALTRTPPDFNLEQSNMPPTDHLTTREAKLMVLEKTKALVTRATEKTKDGRERYKAYHDKKVRSLADIKVGDRVFLNRPPQTYQSIAEKLSDEPRTKLSKKTEPHNYEVIEVKDGTVKIVKGDLEDVLSLDRVTRAPSPSIQRLSRHTILLPQPSYQRLLSPVPNIRLPVNRSQNSLSRLKQLSISLSQSMPVRLKSQRLTE